MITGMADVAAVMTAKMMAIGQVVRKMRLK
jgi:hypothetical protein